MSAGDVDRPSGPRERDAVLIDTLTADLRPVRRFPRPAAAAAVVVAAWLVLAAFAIGREGLRPDLVALARSAPDFAAACVGLALLAAGALGAALGGAVPGRESALGTGLRVALAGLAIGISGCLAAGMHGGFHRGVPAAADWACLRGALAFASLPALAAGIVCARGFVARPWLEAVLVLAAAGAMGALLVHVGCPFAGPRHFLLGHLGAPVALAALGSAPLGAALQRAAR